MAQGIKLFWLKIILKDLKIKWETLMRLYCDYKLAINIAHNPIQHNRTKQVEINRYFIKKKLDSDLICTPYMSLGSHLDDVLMKGLASA